MWVLFTLAFTLSLKIYTVRAIREMNRRIVRLRHEMRGRREELSAMQRRGAWIAGEQDTLAFRHERMRQTVGDLQSRLERADPERNGVIVQKLLEKGDNREHQIPILKDRKVGIEGI